MAEVRGASAEEARGDVRLFPEEGTTGGCASGDCLTEDAGLGAPAPGSVTAKATPAEAPRASPTSPAATAQTPPAIQVRVTNVTPPPPADFEPVNVGAVDEPDEDPVPPPQPVRSSSPAKGDDPTRALQDRWRAAVEAVKAVSTRHGSSLAHSRVLWIRPGEISVAFTKQAEFHRTVISGSGKVTAEKALSEFFGRETKLTIELSQELANAAARSLAEEDAVIRQERERGADRQVRTHPAILSTLKILGGEIEHIQVVEPERPALNAAPSDPEVSDG